MADSVPAQFFDLGTISSDWRLTCAKHGNVKLVVMFNNDVTDTVCQQCWKEDLQRSTGKCTFNANGGPQPAAVKPA